MTSAVTLSYGQVDLLSEVPLPASAAAPPLAGLSAGLSLAAAGDMALSSERGFPTGRGFLTALESPGAAPLRLTRSIRRR